MAAPSFVSQTTLTLASRTNTSFGAPSGIQDNDILIAWIGVVGTTITAAPPGFTAIGTPLTDGGVTFYTYWKRAASESGPYAWNHTNAQSVGWLGCYRGCIASGSPIDVSSVATGTSATITAPTVTTTVNDALLVYLSARTSSATALAPPAGMTERFDSYTYSADQGFATAGATGARTQAISSQNWGARLIAFKPAASSGVTGTLAATESGSDTAAMAGGVIVSGSVAVTEAGSDTATVSGGVLIDGALAATESGADALAASGGVLVSGALGATEIGMDAAVIIGSLPIAGTLAVVETGSDMASFSGASVISGTLAATESGTDAAAISGSVLIAGVISAVEAGADTFAGSGGLASGVVGSMAAQEAANDNFTAVGSVLVSGVMAATESGADLFSSGFIMDVPAERRFSARNMVMAFEVDAAIHEFAASGSSAASRKVRA